MASRGVIFGSVLVVLTVGCSVGEQAGGVVDAVLYVDLLRYVPEPTGEAGELRVATSKLDGDNRPALALRVQQRVELGPLDAAGFCTLDFAFASSRRAGKRAGTVAVQAWVKRGESESSLFSEDIDLSDERAQRWQAREIEIPQGEGPFSIVLGSTRRGRKAPTKILWGSPHLRCSQKLDSPRKDKPDVILISLDTLRRDRLGLYGYGAATSPTLDAFAAESVVFENAFSVANYTLPTHASMFTGLYPAQHGAGHASMSAPLSPDVATLAEILSAAKERRKWPCCTRARTTSTTGSIASASPHRWTRPTTLAFARSTRS